jgi:hypothetical protein
LKRLLINVQATAKQRFGRQPLRVWYAKVGSDAYRALVFNTESKLILCTGPLSDSPEGALSALRTDLGWAPKTNSR